MSKDDNTGLWSEAEEGRQLAISDPSVVSGSYTADKNIFYAVNTFLTRDLHGHLINAEDMPHNSRFIYHIGDCTTILAYESYNKSLNLFATILFAQNGSAKRAARLRQAIRNVKSAYR